MIHATACHPAPARRPPPAAHDDRRAYTLLELLIVGVLLSVLLLGVWSLFRSWSGLYERGEVRARRLQLARSLCDQFAEDLLAVTPGATLPTASSDSASSSSRAAGESAALAEQNALVGGADWIVLSVVQPANPWRDLAAGEEPRDVLSEPSTELALAAPELCRVVYSFTPPEPEFIDSLSSRVAELAAEDDTELVAEESEATEPASGLSRLVVAHEAAMDASGAALLEMHRAGSRDDALGATAVSPPLAGAADYGTAAEGASTAMPSRELPADADRARGILQRDEVPEVESFSLRYFDGTTWLASWNSQSQGRLPVAVELRFTLKVEAAEQPEPELREGETLADTEPVSLRESTPLRDESDNLTSSQRDAAGADADEELPAYQRWIVLLGPATGRDKAGEAQWEGEAPAEPFRREGEAQWEGEAPAEPFRREGEAPAEPSRRAGDASRAGDARWEGEAPAEPRRTFKSGFPKRGS
jgi:type II secretory pathway pseudopilin PulG